MPYIAPESALDYLIKVRDYSFMEAVELIAGGAVVKHLFEVKSA